MLNRTRREDIVFKRPFTLKGWAEPQPAGAYAVDTEEELMEGLSFPAYRGVSTTITRQASPRRGARPGDPGRAPARWPRRMRRTARPAKAPRAVRVRRRARPGQTDRDARPGRGRDATRPHARGSPTGFAGYLSDTLPLAVAALRAGARPDAGGGLRHRRLRPVLGPLRRPRGLKGENPRTRRGRTLPYHVAAGRTSEGSRMMPDLPAASLPRLFTGRASATVPGQHHWALRRAAR